MMTCDNCGSTMAVDSFHISVHRRMTDAASEVQSAPMELCKICVANLETKIKGPLKDLGIPKPPKV